MPEKARVVQWPEKEGPRSHWRVTWLLSIQCTPRLDVVIQMQMRVQERTQKCKVMLYLPEETQLLHHARHGWESQFLALEIGVSTR